MGDATVVLTQDNAQEFYAQKMARPELPMAAQAEQVAESEPADGVKPAAEATPQEPKEGKPSKVHYRFSELTEQMKAAEAKAVEAEAKAKASEEARGLAEKRASESANRARELEAKLNPPKEKLGAEPEPTQFTDAKEYAKAWADWNQEKTEEDRAQKESLAAQQRVADDHSKRVADFVKATPDFPDIVAKTSVVVHNAVRDAIMESEYGPQLIYHLALHPEEAEGLKKLPVASQVRRIGRLETLFEKPAAKEEPKAAKPAAVAHEVSRAPEPIAPLTGGNASPDSPVDSKGEFHGTYADWKAARKAGRIK